MATTMAGEIVMRPLDAAEVEIADQYLGANMTRWLRIFDLERSLDLSVPCSEDRSRTWFPIGLDISDEDYYAGRAPELANPRRPHEVEIIWSVPGCRKTGRVCFATPAAAIDAAIALAGRLRSAATQAEHNAICDEFYETTA